MSCYFYGCWNGPGHFFWMPGGRYVSGAAQGLEYFGSDHAHIDGGMAPRSRDGAIVWRGQGSTLSDRQHIEYRSAECPQGQFLLHHLGNGHTAIQWWDRTQGDTRGGCNSTVLLEGEHTADEMLAALREHFPHVLANLTKAGVELVQVHATTRASP